MFNLNSVETLVALLLLGIGPGSGIYLFGRWAMRGIEELRQEFKAFREAVQLMNQQHNDLRERVTLTEHRLGVLEGRVVASMEARAHG